MRATTKVKASRARDMALALLVSYTLAFSMLFPFNMAVFQAFADEGLSSSEPSSEQLAEKESYSITFNYGDGKSDTQTCQEGETPTPPANTSKADTAKFSYAFSHWEPSIAVASGNVTYTAIYTETRRSYTVTWLDEGGAVLASGSVEYGSVPTYAGPVPTKPEDASYTYEFKEWQPAPSAVTGDASYKASYTATEKGGGDPDPGDGPDPDPSGGEDPQPSSFTVSFSVAGDADYGIPLGGEAPDAAAGIEAGADYTLPAPPATGWTTSDGTDAGVPGTWSFTGWSSSESYSDSVAQATIAADIIFFGKWTFAASDGGEADLDPTAPKLTFKIELDDDNPNAAFKKGETARFVITVTNEGKGAIRNVEFSSDLSTFLFDMYKKAFDKTSLSYDLLDKDNLVTQDSTSATAWVDGIEPGKHVTLRAEFKVTADDVKAGEVAFTVKARGKDAKDAEAEFESDEHTIKTTASSGGGGSSGADQGEEKDDEEEAYIAAFAVGYGNPQVVNGLKKPNPLTPVKISEKGQTVQLGVILTWSDYSPQTYANKLDPPMNITWTSSDESVATVDANGLVTPQGKNSTVTISAKGSSSRDNPKDCPLSGSITIEFSNQNEDGVLHIYYRDGTEIPTEGRGSTIQFEGLGSKFAKTIYATFEYKGKVFSSVDARNNTHTIGKDKVSFDFAIENEFVARSNYPGGGVTWVYPYDKAEKSTTMLVAQVFADGNYFYRTVKITLDADPDWDKSGGIVPANLTISVSWELDPNPSDPATRETVFSLAELNQMATLRQAYTMIANRGSWDYAYQTARGVKLVDLFNACEIYEEDVYAIEVKATDNNTVTSAFMSIDQFFSTPRYYYPNYYMDSNTRGAVPAFAMIAVASNVFKSSFTEYGKELAKNFKAQRVDNLYSPTAMLDAPDQTQPRLCLGASGTQALGGSYSVKNVERIHVILKGAPPVEEDQEAGEEKDEESEEKDEEPEEKDEEPEEKDKPKEKDDSKKQGGGSGGTQGDGSGSGDKDGSGTGSGSDGGDGKGSASGDGTGGGGDSNIAGSQDGGTQDSDGVDGGSKGAAGAQAASKSASAQDSKKRESTSALDSKDGGPATQRSTSEQSAGESRSTPNSLVDATFSMFQMISNTVTQAPITFFENPWAKYFVLFVDLIVLAGATRVAVWYALQKRRPARG